MMKTIYVKDAKVWERALRHTRACNRSMSGFIVEAMDVYLRALR